MKLYLVAMLALWAGMTVRQAVHLRAGEGTKGPLVVFALLLLWTFTLMGRT